MYDHFIRMYSILFEKLKRDEQNAEKEKEEEESENLQNFLVQLQLVADLLFMADLSHLLTITSKEFQRFDVLSFHAMNKYFKLKNYLHSARTSFVELNSPSVIHFKKSYFHQAYSVWKSFGEHINTIISTQTFENVKLLTRSERGRVTRSQIRASLGIEKEDFRSIINQKFKMYVTYIDSVIGHLQ